MSGLENIGNSYGWLANNLTIVVSVFTIVAFVFGLLVRAYKKGARMKKERDMRASYNSLYSFVSGRKEFQTFSPKSCKIAIIDDQPEHYPVDYLRRLGYNITVYEEISLADYEFVGKYDLVFLDITNVVKEDPEKGGFELIKKIRSNINAVVIIAASSKRFDPTLSDFFKLANEQAKTPIRERECEELIDRVLNKYYSPVDVAQRIDKYLSSSDLTSDQHKTALDLIVLFVSSNSEEDGFLQSLSQVSHKIDAHRILPQVLLLKGLL